jgi:putative transposase
MDEEDRLRFVHDLFEFNDQAPVSNTGYFFKGQYIDLRSRYIEKPREKRKFLVKILSFCLMLNHYHLMLNPVVENGITRFMRKLNIGYAKYFNQKYERKGALFEGRYKSILIENNAHFLHLPYYIHLNPLDLSFPEWREGQITNYKEAMKVLEKYRWSSFLDYIGQKNFPSVTQRELLMKFFGGPRNYKKETIGWLKDVNLEEIKDLTLE